MVPVTKFDGTVAQEYLVPFFNKGAKVTPVHVRVYAEKVYYPCVRKKKEFYMDRVYAKVYVTFM
jgi:hypothetical protein